MGIDLSNSADVQKNLDATTSKSFNMGSGYDSVSNIINILFGSGNSEIVNINGDMGWRDNGGTRKKFKSIVLESSGMNGSSFVINTDNVTEDAEDSQLEFEVGTGTNAVIKYNSTDKTFDLNKPVKLGETKLSELSSGELSIGENKIFHEGNDGTGSGVDADLLDGQHANEFAPINHVSSGGDAHAEATESANGFINSEDKIKLNNLFIYTDVSSSANAIEVTASPAITSYRTGMTAFIKIANTVTGVTTVKFNSLDTKNLKKYFNLDIEADDITAGQIIVVQYDGTNFQLVSDIKLKGTPVFKELIDNKGDLFVGSADNTLIKLPAGSSGQVLTANTSATYGVEWKTPEAQPRTSLRTVNSNMDVNKVYIPDSVDRLEFTLPVTASVGNFIEIIGKGSGGWKIIQNADQQILLGDTFTTAGITGYAQSSNNGDTVRLVCVTSNNIWRASFYIGNVTVA